MPCVRGTRDINPSGPGAVYLRTRIPFGTLHDAVLASPHFIGSVAKARITVLFQQDGERGRGRARFPPRPSPAPGG